jgi:hypothetical protein
MATGKSLQTMVTRIVGELGQRADLAPGGAYPTIITDAIFDAVTIYQKERFRFNELVPLTPFVINTVQGQYIYTAADDARIGLLMDVDYINYLLGNTPERMDRVFPEDVYLATIPGQQAGPPQEFAWDGQSIVIYPAPPAVSYPLTIGGYLAVAGPTLATITTDTTNPWMNDAEMLIRSRAKYEIALNFTRNDKMVAAMSPDAGSGGASERFYNMLKGEANKIRGTSRVRGMKF